MSVELYKGYRIEIDYDQFGSNPAEWGNFSIVTFNRGGYAMDALITDVDEDEYYDEDGNLSREMMEDVTEGRAWPFIIRKHGNSLYELTDDLTKPSGFIILEPEHVAHTKTTGERRAMAASDLDIYTQWANGEVYTVVVTDPYGDEVEDDGRMGDIIGYDDALGFAKQVVDSHGINYATKAKRAQELHA